MTPDGKIIFASLPGAQARSWIIDAATLTQTGVIESEYSKGSCTSSGPRRAKMERLSASPHGDSHSRTRARKLYIGLSYRESPGLVVL